MTTYRYFSCGSESEREGITLAVNSYYDDGTFMSGIFEPEKHLYKCKEITKEQYDIYTARLHNENELRGLYGLVNEEGKRKALAFFEEQKREKIERNEAQIALSVRKIKKLLQLEIIEQGDVDTEIEQQGMSEFKDEIKRRLEQN